MTQTETQFWNKLKSFQLDEADAALTFSQRLARENGWNKEYTHRVIEEYKKFIFLCCTSPTSVTPSDPVDQAWHLHLTYTKSYWSNLCKNTLEREIHHNPTKGGKEEQQKFNNLYTELHQIYFEKFGTNPPPDIWHDNNTRFSDINFQRVNLNNYWLLKKPRLSRLYPPGLLLQLFVFAISTLMIQATGNGFILVLFVIGFIIAFVNRNNNNGKGGNNRTDGSGCSSFSCTSGEGHSGCSTHHGDSGCSSSGCSGCGSGCGGD
ncbi:glycine-rich domain-containing protein [Flavobacterium suzhouense]|uniref:Glycine-rich domain-containing protein n=1 Tax=Flavobacterium suzhouense TaxID=1529638 RepID=A0ABW5NSA0_9FLAO